MVNVLLYVRMSIYTRLSVSLFSEFILLRTLSTSHNSLCATHKFSTIDETDTRTSVQILKKRIFTKNGIEDKLHLDGSTTGRRETYWGPDSLNVHWKDGLVGVPLGPETTGVSTEVGVGVYSV